MNEEKDGLRNRKNISEAKQEDIAKVTEKYIDAVAEKIPLQIKPYLKQAAPYIGMFVKAVEMSIPMMRKIFAVICDFWIKLSPYRPELLAPAGFGLILCFFGGSFLTLIAAVEAYRICGYQTTLKCLKKIYDDFVLFVEASKEDDKVDADGDGKSDVIKLSSEQLITRKTLLFMKTIDPRGLMDAAGGIQVGFLAVIATLKLQFAKAITLGVAIGDGLNKPAQQFLVQPIEFILGEEYKKWASPGVEAVVKTIAVSIAWFIQRVISAFHSSIRGGLMFSRSIIQYLSEMKYVDINHEDTIIDEVVGYALAVLGFYFQLSYGFGLPFPLNLLLLPVSIAEYLLMWAVNRV